MKQLLVIREHLLKLYQNNARIIKPLCQFVMAVILFSFINQRAGYNPALRPWYVIVVFSVISAMIPSAVILLLVVVYTVMHIYYVSIILAVVLLLVFAVIYFIYIRFVPAHGHLILAVLAFFALRIPFVVPLVLGLLSTPFSILPMVCGTLFYYSMDSLTAVAGIATEDSPVLYNQAVQLLFTNQEMYLTIAIFTVVLVLVYLIRRMEFDHAFEISILAGALLNLILFLIANVILDIHYQIPFLLLQTVICTILAEAVHFFKVVLNYSAVEYLQFEDDEYYYYVKAVPKVSIPKAEVKVKRFNAHLLGAGVNEKVKQDSESED